jgi:hypothetical protein
MGLIVVGARIPGCLFFCFDLTLETSVVSIRSSRVGAHCGRPKQSGNLIACGSVLKFYCAKRFAEEPLKLISAILYSWHTQRGENALFRFACAGQWSVMFCLIE